MLSEADIVEMIMRFAAACGDPTPTAIRYVHGTRGDLNRVLGAEMFGDDAATPAVLVEATGDFRWPRAVGLVPRHPTGHVITLVVNKDTGESFDAGIGPGPHDLSALGELHCPAVPK